MNNILFCDLCFSLFPYIDLNDSLFGFVFFSATHGLLSAPWYIIIIQSSVNQSCNSAINVKLSIVTRTVFLSSVCNNVAYVWCGLFMIILFLHDAFY